jgi:hypothetical protein
MLGTGNSNTSSSRSTSYIAALSASNDPNAVSGVREAPRELTIPECSPRHPTPSEFANHAKSSVVKTMPGRLSCRTSTSCNSPHINVYNSHCQHRRNKTTISDISEMTTSNAFRGLSSQAELGLRSAIVEDREEQFGSNLGDSFVTRQTVIKRKSVVSSNPSNNTRCLHYQDSVPQSPTPDPMQSNFLSNIAEQSSPCHQRTVSGSSSHSSSTVASDSWNPVENFIRTSSSDGDLNPLHAVSLFDSNSDIAPLPKLVVKRNTDPIHLSLDRVRQVYPLDRLDLAGHDHGVAVYDAAYVLGKAPESDLEWDNLNLSFNYGDVTHSR